jgi:quercetin dioxygenase-like cupin family protein
MNIFNKQEVKFVPKGWGFEKFIENNDLYCGKLLFFVKGKKCSVHYHKIKTETFYVHKGELEVWFHDDAEQLEKLIEEKGEKAIFDYMEKTVLEQGDTFFVPVGRVHMMKALKDTEMFEFSTHHEDSDSYRLIKGD